MNSTDEGMQIDFRDEQASNADSPSLDIRERLSNVTVERSSHIEKQKFEITSIDDGMQID
jgi:hypothetical protein